MNRLRFSASIVLVSMLAAVLSDAEAVAQEASRRYAVLIGGLGGTEEHTAAFQRYLLDTRRALVDYAGYRAEDVVVLAESEGAEFVTGISSAENVRTRFEALASEARPNDQVLVILFGHGSYDGERAYLNIPRRDLSDADYAALLDALPVEHVVFVNTASASAPFAQSLSAPGRIVITATRMATQRNETVFPRFFVEALGDAGDLDKDGNLSIREVFTYAAEQTNRHFEVDGNVPTEHALLEDTGDGEGHRLEELEEAGEGNLAGVTYLRRRDAALALANAPRDSPLGQMVLERERLERSVAELKSQKSSLDEDEYYARLEALFIELARLNDRIETLVQ